LDPAGRVHTELEFFRANHRNKEIGKEQQRDYADDDGFHIGLKFVAKAHIKSAHDEKQNYGSGEKDVVHKSVGRYYLLAPRLAVFSVRTHTA
jgi:hypothetical protein